MYLRILMPVIILCLLACKRVQGIQVAVIGQEALVVPAPNVLATVLLLDIEPGDVGLPVHYHSGPVVGYVAEGEFLLQVNEEHPQIISAGNVYYQKDRTKHVWSANASNDTVCKVIAVVFGRPDEDVATFVEDYKRKSWTETLSEAKRLEKSKEK